MQEVFKTVMTMSLSGGVIAALLLAFKPIALKKFPAKWQYYAWIGVLVIMTVPIYKMIPKRKAEKIFFITQNNETVQTTEVQTQHNHAENETYITEITPDREEVIFNIFAYIWFGGMCLYSAVIVSSYFVFITKKRRKSVDSGDNTIIADVKKQLKIKRRIRIRMSSDIGSPMLVGVIFPTVYIPKCNLSDESFKMILLHELMHFKRNDLVLKWFSQAVNAVHWFNPFSYLLSASIGETCEISCDMAVTKNMTEEEKKKYMITILEMVE